MVELREGTGARKGTTLVRVRKAVWGMLYAADAGVVSKIADRLANDHRCHRGVWGVGLTASEKKTEPLLMRIKEKKSPPPPPPPPLSVEAGGQRYTQTIESECLGGLVAEHGYLNREINDRCIMTWVCSRKFGGELFDRPGAPFRFKVRLLFRLR